MTMMLWAQAALPLETLSWGALVGVAFFTFLAVAAVAGIWQEREKTRIAHAETLKRLELGIPDPPVDRSWPLAFVCVAIGFGVPAVAFGATLIAYLNKNTVDHDIWIAPCIVSVVGVVMAGTLAWKLFRPLASDRNGTIRPGERFETGERPRRLRFRRASRLRVATTRTRPRPPLTARSECESVPTRS